MHNILIVVYSNTGTCMQIARRLCAEHGWALGTIREARMRRGWRGILRCVADGWLHRKPCIRYQGPDVHAFDTVVLLSPVWAARLAAPMRSFLAAHASRLRHYAVLSVSGSHAAAAHAEADVDRLTGRSPVLRAAFSTREIEDGSYAARLSRIASALDGLPGSPAPHLGVSTA